MAVAACLKAADDAAEVHLHLFPDEQDAMQMVWHDLCSQHLDARYVLFDGHPALPHLFAQRRQADVWCVRCPRGCVSPPRELSQQGLSPLHRHSDEVNAA